MTAHSEEKSSVTLIGHYNPIHEYPYQVIPVLRNDAGLLVAYHMTPIASFQPISPNLKIIEHTDILKDRLKDYDPATHGLFALSSENVVSYNRDKAEWFYQRLFRSHELEGMNPFSKLSLAKFANIRTGLDSLVRSCLLELGLHGSDDFAQEWYSQRREDISPDLPPEIGRFIDGFEILNVVCMPDDEDLLLTLSRVANDRAASYQDSQKGVFLIAPEVHDWLPPSPGEIPVGVDAVLREADSADDLSQAILLGASEVVLAVRREYIEHHKLEPTWESVFGAAVNDIPFRWIRPRVEAISGRLVESALDDMRRRIAPELSEGEYHQRLNRQVHKYAKFDQDAVDTAVFGDVWNVDAVITKRHSATRLFMHLEDVDDVILISYREPLWSTYFVLANRRVKHDRITFLEELCASTELKMRLHQTKFNANIEIATTRIAALAARSYARVATRERPIAVCLLMDVSASMRGEKLEAAKQGMTALLSGLHASRADAVGLISFSDAAHRSVAMGAVTEIVDNVEASIRRLQAAGRTALLDAVILASEELASWSGYARAIVVLTDGCENASRSTLIDIQHRLSVSSENSKVFGVAYGDDADYNLLRRLAEITGGTVLAGSIRNIEQLYQHILERL